MNGRHLGIFVLILEPKTRRICSEAGQPTDEAQQHHGKEKQVGQPTDEGQQGHGKEQQVGQPTDEGQQGHGEEQQVGQPTDEGQQGHQGSQQGSQPRGQEQLTYEEERKIRNRECRIEGISNMAINDERIINCIFDDLISDLVNEENEKEEIRLRQSIISNLSVERAVCIIFDEIYSECIDEAVECINLEREILWEREKRIELITDKAVEIVVSKIFAEEFKDAEDKKRVSKKLFVEKGEEQEGASKNVTIEVQPGGMEIHDVAMEVQSREPGNVAREIQCGGMEMQESEHIQVTQAKGQGQQF